MFDAQIRCNNTPYAWKTMKKSANGNESHGQWRSDESNLSSYIRIRTSTLMDDIIGPLLLPHAVLGPFNVMESCVMGPDIGSLVFAYKTSLAKSSFHLYDIDASTRPFLLIVSPLDP
jgi:hypothetical protein